MNNPDSVLVNVMDSMVQAGWLRSYRSLESNHWNMVWTVNGARRARLLKIICLSHGLGDSERAVIHFDALCHGETPSPNMEPADVNELTASFWRESVADLGIKGDEIRLLGMARVVIAWAPSSDSVISSVTANPMATNECHGLEGFYFGQALLKISFLADPN